MRPDTSRTLVELNGEVFTFRTRRIKVIKINALEGDDRILLRSEPTFFCGLCGMPTELDATAFASAVPTLLVGGAGADSIIGGIGRDRIYGRDGDDTLHGELGNDLLDGGPGNDALDGFLGDDILIGAAGNDTLEGRLGDDQLLAGDGNDILYADSMADFLWGGDGQDLLRYPIYVLNIDGSSPPPAFNVPADIELKESFFDMQIR